MVLTTATHRPRNINSLRAGSILYGDWGTSKAYVVGLAFALAQYSSFWLILAVSLLSVLIGLNYITICKYYPNGGGVYASVRHRSPIISMIGAFFLIADYLVTAALSALSAGYYFGLGDPILFAAIAIGIIGALNYFGPKHMGTAAFLIVIIGFTTMTLLAAVSLPFLKLAASHIKPLQGGSWTIWSHFVGVIVALSGIEAIANATGIMKLDPGSTVERPTVKKTAAKAIFYVMLEVAIYTSLFGFALAAITGFEFVGDTINAPGNPDVRDYILRYMGEVFAGTLFGLQAGQIFGVIISIAVGLLLLSAVNTAFTGLIALQYLMARDGEVPKVFARLNQYGVPLFPLIVSTLIPIGLILAMKDVAALAALYAIGFVGAIATNLGSTSTDFQLPLLKRERVFMFFGFLIMAAVEITLFVDKPHARNFAVAVILVGLILRGMASEFKFKKMIKKSLPTLPRVPLPPVETLAPASILCPVDQVGKTLEVAIQKSKKRHLPIHILFIREQKVISEKDVGRSWESDAEAAEIYDYIKREGDPSRTFFYYCVSDSRADMIAAYAMRLEVTQLFIGLPRRGPIMQMLWGNLVQELSGLLPEEVQIYVIP
jgi:amino acid transporter